MRLSFSFLTITLALIVPFATAVSGAARAILDPSSYKNITVSRGIKYNYYLSPPRTNDQRFLLFLHGFPGLSYDYRFQVDFFKDAGYGIIVPDMLGYGGTDKPTDTEMYKSSLVTRDIVDILDAESVPNDVVVVGHDWGSKITARLAQYFPKRFSAFGFLAVGGDLLFSGPYAQSNNLTKAVIGYELFGYWDFFAQPDAPQLIGDHLDSLLSLFHSADPLDWIVHFAPLGALEASLKEDRKAKSTVWTPEEAEVYLKAYSAPGALEASLSWYKLVVSDIESKDSQGIPPENLIVAKPVFLGAALADFVLVAPQMIQSTLDSSTNSTIRVYPAGHWLHWEVKDEVNRDLFAWIEGLE
ncbi:hypothetical protein V5O48_009538 [Marasmius crinis-equi]|uniref:AB hydrolase-1 domain-containing protein n=1 Tax=Marasmius crinis-equi TaxID=585013 RepID=A0ABR3FB12_9AGAR